MLDSTLYVYSFTIFHLFIYGILSALFIPSTHCLKNKSIKIQTVNTQK